MSARPASSWEHASGASAMGYSGGNKQLPSYQGAIILLHTPQRPPPRHGTGLV